MSKHLKKIGIFDSGIGGLTILKPLLQTFPAEYLYLADTAFIPYGNKSQEVIINRIQEIVTYFENNEVDLIIVACHTASAIALDEIQSSVPIFSMLDHTLETLLPQESAALLATDLTIKSGAYQHYLTSTIKNFYPVACPNLASAIEEHYGQDSEKIKAALAQALTPLNDLALQSIILACTHYTLVAPMIQEMMPSISIIAPTNITTHLKRLGDPYYRAPQCTFIQTGTDPLFATKVRKYLALKELESQKILIRPRFMAHSEI